MIQFPSRACFIVLAFGVALAGVTYLDRVKAPLLMISGLNDPRVPVGEAIQIHDALEKRGMSTPLIIFADAGHGTFKRADQVLWVGHILKFFEENLKGKGEGMRRQ